MKVTQLVRRFAATSSLVVAGFSVFAYSSSSQAAGQASDGLVLFSQSHISAGAPDGTALLRAPAAGGAVRQLTPLNIGRLDLNARWSPHGGAIVFERVNATQWFTQSEIYRMDRNSGKLQQITVGKSRHQYPVWGPSQWIAFIEGGVDTHQCLALVRSNGDDQHVLFCPGSTDAVFQAPQWSLDGKNVFAEVHYYGNEGVNPTVYSDVYKVDVSNGKATRISHLDIGDVAHFSISPDGKHGVYAWDATSAMELVDFTTGKTVGSEFGDLYGTSPVWSHNGNYVAFAKDIDVPGSAYGTFGAVFAMAANGSQVTQVTRHPVAFDYYSPVEWSADDSRILLNRTRYVIQGAHPGQYFSVHVLDLRTQAITTVTNNGTADVGAWEQP